MAKRSGESVDIISSERLISILSMERIPLRVKALISFLYLTGCRISEALEIKKSQLQKETRGNTEFLMIYDVNVLKRRGNVKNTKPINIKKEKFYVNCLINYLDKNKSEWLFPSLRGNHIKPRWARRLIYKQTRLFPHYFRHLRNTHLITNYGFNSWQLRQFNKWASPGTAEHYVHLTSADVVDKMK